MNLVLLNICLVVAVTLVKGNDVLRVTSASSVFSQNLYTKIAAGKANAIYSPYSIHACLSLALLGAREDTADEINKTLGLTSLPGSAANKAYRDLIVQLNSSKNVTINTANAIFANPNVTLEVQFVNDAKEYYFANVSNFDLAAVGGPEKKINDFVENKTEGLIKNIIPSGAVDALTISVLVNTIYFNGIWQTQFSEYKTQKQTFYQLDGNQTQVDMMKDERDMNIKRGSDGVDVGEFPFVNSNYSLFVALPKKYDGLPALETSLSTPGYVDKLFQGLTATRVKVGLPKFKIESTFDLNTPLQQLGIVKAFDPRTANFQGISKAASCHISNVIHKAVIEVKETGTVAAAATVIIMRLSAMLQPAAETFIADRPFIFFLRDNVRNHILFQGNYYAG
jgi:serine protease inhibitor